MLLALSSFGQTYNVSLFGADFCAAFNLSDGTLGAATAADAVMGALTLARAGRLIDLTTVERATGCFAALLSLACLLAAAAMHVVMLGIACVFLRPCGARSCIMRAAV